MYRSNRQQLEFPDFYLPFSGQLDPENRWVKLAKLVPWGLAEEIYHADLCENESAAAIQVAMRSTRSRPALTRRFATKWKASSARANGVTAWGV